jgi:two-component system, cell cycle response regulator
MTKPRRRRHDVPQESDDTSIRVLVTDDDPEFLAYLASLTRRLGLATETALDGDEALEKLATGQFHLLLCDFQMPRRNGLEVIEEVRARPSTAHIYAVMLTAHDETALKIHALSLGFDDFLPKGCTEVEVVAKVAAARRMIARQRQLDAAVRQWKGIASHDELTGVYSRRFFFDEATRLLEEKREIAVLLFDLDNFKVINDSLGHVAGDQVLREIGGVFLRGTRHDDVIARYGGDEFVLLVTDTSMEQTYALADRLRAEIATVRTPLTENTLSVSASVGIGFSSLIAEATVNLVLEAADRDLYARKWIRKNPPSTSDTVYKYPRSSEGSVIPIPTYELMKSSGPVGALPIKQSRGESE